MDADTMLSGSQPFTFLWKVSNAEGIYFGPGGLWGKTVGTHPALW
ncbi:MAG: hypothetical protein ABJE99_23395 [Roseobacter sp.]